MSRATYQKMLFFATILSITNVASKLFSANQLSPAAPPFDSAQGTAFDSAQGTAFDSAQGTAFDSAQGTAFGSAQGAAFDGVYPRPTPFGGR